MNRLKLILVVFLALLIIPISGMSQNLADKKISKSLFNKINKTSSNYEHLIWIHLDKSAISENVVALSEKSLKRRAKVDPDNFLIDEKEKNKQYRFLLQRGFTNEQIKIALKSLFKV